MNVDPWILALSAITVLATIAAGFWSARRAKTASDFFVAGRSVSVGWNASAISGEYLSAASFMGVAGMVMSSGYDALWYPVCYACGYLFLLLFIAGPLRRFGAYTIPDFAEGRFDSPGFRKIAVCFVLFIGFFYTMPQMKGAGTTLAYIFPGLPYWVGVALVGVVITLNVSLGGMKGITLVQAFQYWAKMFAISVPVFVLMSVYGNYGEQLKVNSTSPNAAYKVYQFQTLDDLQATRGQSHLGLQMPAVTNGTKRPNGLNTLLATAEAKYKKYQQKRSDAAFRESDALITLNFPAAPMELVLEEYQKLDGRDLLLLENEIYLNRTMAIQAQKASPASAADLIKSGLAEKGFSLIPYGEYAAVLVPTVLESKVRKFLDDYAVSKIHRGDLPEKAPKDATWIAPFGPLTTKAVKAASAKLPEKEQKLFLEKYQKPYSLLYTYSLIIALVCGTAGLPHILVRFYTNPDGAAAKRTTMWVMILIGVFYVFPPVFGVLGRNLMPELYNGLTGVKGTDGIVLRLPIILREKYGVMGSILSGVTCAGAFAAFMSTFSGLLVSMTGALAHDVYGRILRPQSTPAQRMRAFKIGAVVIGLTAILLGSLVENFEINFMVGQAFAIAASSYFPLLFMSVWWRKMTMKGAAAGTLGGGVLALAGISLTSYTTFVVTMAAKYTPETMPGWLAGLKANSLETFWAMHPLTRILCEQPAIWAVPLAITLMVVVSKMTASEIPKDIRMKMLVLHAPEKLGLKQEYIQEQAGH